MIYHHLFDQVKEKANSPCPDSLVADIMAQRLSRKRVTYRCWKSQSLRDVDPQAARPRLSSRLASPTMKLLCATVRDAAMRAHGSRENL